MIRSAAKTISPRPAGSITNLFFDDQSCNSLRNSHNLTPNSKFFSKLKFLEESSLFTLIAALCLCSNCRVAKWLSQKSNFKPVCKFALIWPLLTKSTSNNCTNYIVQNLKWALNTEIFNFFKGWIKRSKFCWKKNTLTWYAWVREHIILPATKLNQIAERLCVCMQTLIKFKAIS